MHIVNKQVVTALASASLLFISIACNRSSGSAGGAQNNAAAAAVNGKEIMLSEVDLLISQQANGKMAQLPPLDLAAARLQVAEGLIQREVLFQRAEKEKLLPSEEEVTQALNAQKQQGRLTEEEYQKRLQETGKTEQAIREELRKQIAVQRLQEKISGKISISDREVEDFYNNNKQSFVNARGVGLAAIVVDPADNGAQNDAKSEADAASKINIIYQRLKSGADFATVARAESEDPSNLRGGDIGFASEDQLKQNGFPPDLIAKLFGSMQVGDITPAFQTSGGRWSIFKLTARQLQNENLTIDSPGVREQIKDELLNQRRRLLNAALLEMAMNEAKVVNHLAQNMINSPSNLSGLRPAPAGSPAPGGSPAASSTAATPTTSPAATPSSSPGR
ncbi:MAG: SurA N-terminal domain-containing protein, partial [Pyrinomonadaceae bacterium]|nr:SurA N-terminal domain-containing protein [Pyrinomonadaceae bacterium]